MIKIIDSVDLRYVEYPLYLFVAKGCRRVTDQKLDPGEKITVEEVTFDELLERLKTERDMFQKKVVSMLESPKDLAMLRSKMGI